MWGAIESAAEQAQLGVYVAQVDIDPPRIVYINERGAAILGRSREQLLDVNPWTLLRPAERDWVQTRAQLPTADAPPTSFELLLERPDGRRVPIIVAVTRITGAMGVLSFGWFRDVSLERETLEALRGSEARFRFVVESAPDGVVILKRGMIVFINPKAAHLLGVESVEAALGRPIASFLPPADAAAAGARMAAMLRDKVSFPPSEYGVLADRNRIVEIKSTVCEWDNEPAVLALARDVTERKAIERRLVESDRLAALGTLAAGVAHEINNPLTYAQLSTQRIARLLETQALPAEMLAALRNHLADIDHGIKRVASVTQSLRAFVSHDDDDAPRPVDLDGVIDRSLKMVANDLRHAARLVRETRQVPPVIGSEHRLEQVFVNILINAIKALPAHSPTPHEIRVSLDHEGDRVTATVQDTGTGIPHALRGRIFDPFFTTRDIGHGMGLGLSVSKTIVEKYGGQIDVDSVENAGTTVFVHLRAYRGSVPAPPPSETRLEPPIALPRLRILVVDDERIICEVLERILGTDHAVTSARTGEEALAQIAANRFDVILCDVMMPGIDGIEVYKRIATEHPGLERRLIFMSGGIMGSEHDTVLGALANPRLPKPFTVERVLELVALVVR